jgi:WD40 repeat protein
LLLPDTFSQDGKYAILHSLDNVYRVWETANAEEISRMVIDSDVFSVSFSPDGRYIVSKGLTTTLDTSVRVWKTDTGDEIAPLAQEGNNLSIFTPDGNYWAVGYADTIHIWDIRSKKELSQLLHDDLVDFTFSPDGKYIISADFDRTIRVWVWQPNDLLVSACSRITRNLTRAEWNQYIGDALPYQAVCPNLPIEPEVIITPTP